MPSIKDFEKNKKKKNHNQGHDQSQDHNQNHNRNQKVDEDVQGDFHSVNENASEIIQKEKRRPSKEIPKDIPNEIPIEFKNNQQQGENDMTMHDQEPQQQEFEDLHSTTKIHIQFPGSELLRSRFGKTFSVVEKVATDWVNDGDFEGLPVGHPLLQIATSASLKKAKEIEKKIQQTQAFSLAKMGFEFAKSKLKK